MSDQVAVSQSVLQLLNFGDRSSTYKHAVLIALLDLCLEHTDARGFAPSMVTTRQLAEKVLELYWPQVAPFGDRGAVLLQNTGKQGQIVRQVSLLRELALTSVEAGAGCGRVRIAFPGEYERAVREIEWKLIEMPLPKLQRVERQDTRWLYTIRWDDGANRPKRSWVSAYQRGDDSGFDNRVLFQPGVAEAFAGLHSLLRPFIEQSWANDVAAQNRLDQPLLHQFLFGADRVSLAEVKPYLHVLQNGRCFYCGTPVGGVNEAQIDHFLPWSRHADNGLHNLVLADADCNRDKSAFLPGVVHLRSWRDRNTALASELRSLADSLRWELSEGRCLGAARALYLRLPPTARLWSARRRFEIAEPDRLRAELRA